jgi:hypothetical protein
VRGAGDRVTNSHHDEGEGNVRATTLSAEEILQELRRRKVTVSVRPGRVLNLEPRGEIDGDLEEAIRDQKDAIVDALNKRDVRRARTGGSQAELLVRVAIEADLFRGHDGETGYATVEASGHRETLPIRSRGFKHWLAGEFYKMENRPPSRQAMEEALTTIEACARFDGPVHRVHVRVAPGPNDDATIYIDLANAEREVVAIAADGWRIVSEYPVKFRRPGAMLALPRPERGGTLEPLQDYVNVRDSAHWMLMVGWSSTSPSWAWR